MDGQAEKGRGHNALFLPSFHPFPPLLQFPTHSRGFIQIDTRAITSFEENNVPLKSYYVSALVSLFILPSFARQDTCCQQFSPLIELLANRVCEPKETIYFFANCNDFFAFITVQIALFLS